MSTRHCEVYRCERPAHWGRDRFPGFICVHHGSIWRDSQERLDVLQLGRDWAAQRYLTEKAKQGEVSHGG